MIVASCNMVKIADTQRTIPSGLGSRTSEWKKLASLKKIAKIAIFEEDCNLCRRFSLKKIAKI